MINIDTVYQTVQALANKEQRGYLTPQEFNLMANQAQQDIFEQYIYDLNAVKQAVGFERELGNSVATVLSKLQNTTGVMVSSNAAVIGGTTLVPGPGVHYGRIFVTDALGRKRNVRLIEPDEIYNIGKSKWHYQAFDDFVYFEDGVDKIQVWTGGATGIVQVIANVTCEKISGKPGVAYWGYNIVNEKPVWNPANSQNLSLPVSEQTDIVVKILKLAGISIEDQALYQAGVAEENLNIQQESK